MFPRLQGIEGHRGIEVFRRDLPGEAEFIVINYFESIEAVKRFAGENYTAAVFEPEARKLLSRIETEAHHYEVRTSE